MSIFRELDGKVSSKRTMGVIILFTMLALFTYKELKNLQIENIEVFISFLATAGTLLGITILQRLGKNKENNINN